MNKSLFFFLLISTTLFSQNKETTCGLLSKINVVFQKNHYSPKPVNDSLSAYVFDNFIDEIDNNHTLFTKQEYQKLCTNRLQIDNAIYDKNCDFFDQIVASFTNALERKKAIIEKIEKTNLNYNGIDSIRFSKKAFDFDPSESNIEHIWNKRIRYAILEDIAMQSKNLDSLKQNFTALEKVSRKKIFDTELCKIETALNSKNGVDSDLRSVFLNIFCSYFDPHSSYFSYDDKSSFMSTISTSNLSLGLNVVLNDKDEIVVDEIVPAGPAAKTEKFEKGDIIIKVATTQGESYMASCGSLEKIGSLVFSDTYKDLLLTIRKKNGKILEVKIQKQLMEAIENTIESFVIEKDIRVGYIKIPSFYSNFDGSSNRGCADDVEKEIKKLQNENIEGLIIDLEDNGGGSMEEAQALASMFINSGPLSFFEDNKKNIEVIKDTRKGSIYKDPIIILTNGNSASASEFFTSIMQDYNKAIVVGSTTYGKATMQTILPVDQKNNQDFVKVTIEKFYRVTGKSHQKTGITPDIILPNLYESIIQRENKSKMALVNDSIQTNLKFNSDKNNNTEKAIALSKNRVEKNECFNEIKNLNKQIVAVLDLNNKFLKVDLENVFNLWHDTDSMYEKVKLSAEKEISCKIVNISSTDITTKEDSYKKEKNDFDIKEAKSNPYIEEGLNIIKDLK